LTRASVTFREKLDCRVKPGNDAEIICALARSITDPIVKQPII
jgi:hypothetical protein